MNTTEALLDHFVDHFVEEAVEERPDRPYEQGLVGTVWIKCGASSVASARLERALALRNIRVHKGLAPPNESPCVIVCYADGGEPKEAASEVVRTLAQTFAASILIFAPTLDVGLARTVVQAGAKGFLPTSMPSSQVARAILVAAEGEIVLPRTLLEMIVKEERGPDLGKLRPRQREVLELISEGLSNAQIAERLYLTESTVKQHLRSLYRVLEVKNRHEASRLLWRSDHTRIARRFPQSA